MRTLVNPEKYITVPETHPLNIARELRLREIWQYAPLLLTVARQRAARELGSARESLTDEDYVTWFAEKLGEQLALMKQLRFLNDYRMARCNGSVNANALHESNLSLLAEFHDLDTGVFVDSADLEGVLLTPEQFSTLQSRYDELHALDVAAGRAILQTLALIAYQGDETNTRRAMDRFAESYERYAGTNESGVAIESTL